MYLNSYNHLIQVSYWSRVVYEWSLVISFARVYIFCCLAISGAPKPNTGCGHRGHDTPQNKHQCREYHKYTLGMGTGADILPGGVSFQSQCLSWNTQLPDDSCECAWSSNASSPERKDTNFMKLIRTIAPIWESIRFLLMMLIPKVVLSTRVLMFKLVSIIVSVRATRKHQHVQPHVLFI